MLQVPERFEVGRSFPPWVRYQHESRFAFSAGQVKGLTVADVACGDGSGGRQMLAGGVRRLDAFDISLPAVLAARRQLPGANCLCCAADACSLPVRDSTYDVVVSYETIEHLGDDHAFLNEVVRVLKPGGTFLCSTPNRDLLDPGISINDQPFNKFHVREYSFQKFKALLAPRFSSVVWLGQSMYSRRYITILAAVARLHPKAAVRLHQVRKMIKALGDTSMNHEPITVPQGFEPEIFLAICRDPRRPAP
jgi:ubiquinone/menaquinone biosynthesis C-methylase UbiE